MHFFIKELIGVHHPIEKYRKFWSIIFSIFFLGNLQHFLLFVLERGMLLEHKDSCLRKNEVGQERPQDFCQGRAILMSRGERAKILTPSFYTWIWAFFDQKFIFSLILEQFGKPGGHLPPWLHVRMPLEGGGRRGLSTRCPCVRCLVKTRSHLNFNLLFVLTVKNQSNINLNCVLLIFTLYWLFWLSI